jgi:hypothetical protein
MIQRKKRKLVAGSSGIPADAILEEDGTAILEEDGTPILEET